MGGEIHVESDGLNGSTFVFWLPHILVKREQKRKEKEPTNIVFPGKQEICRVLLAEDNHVNQKVAVRLLKKLGYQVDIANNGQEAVDLAKLTRYSIILVDLEVKQTEKCNWLMPL